MGRVQGFEDGWMDGWMGGMGRERNGTEPKKGESEI